jgi:uncharacterized protein (DUF927 family)
MKPADIRKIAAASLLSFDAVMSELGLTGGKQSGREYLPLNPRRADGKPGSFSVNRDSGAWSDFAVDAKGGDLVSLAAYVLDMGQTEAAEQLGRLLGITPADAPQSPLGASSRAGKGVASPSPRKGDEAPPGVCVMPIPADAPLPPVSHSRHGKPAKRWPYLAANGAVNFYHDRFEPKGERKQFSPLTLWRLPSGKLEWKFKAPPAPRPLCGLDRLAAHGDAPVLVVEGEKAMDAALGLLPNFLPVCWQGGAQAVDKADWTPLAGRRVILWPDADEPGKACMLKLAGILAQVGSASVQVVNLEKLAAVAGFDDVGQATLTPGEPLQTGDDAADLLARGWKAEHLALLLADPAFLLDAAPVDASARCGGKTPEAGAADLAAPVADAPAGEAPAPKRFSVDERGVWLNDTDREGKPMAPRWLCSRLDVLAMVRDPENNGWGLLVGFSDHDRKAHREVIPARDFRGEGLEVSERLLDRGLAIAPKSRPLLLEFLQTSKTKKRARITTRTGWHDGIFVLPDGASGSAGEEWIFELDGAHTFKLKGTVTGWRDDVARLCRGNSRLMFAVSLAFASPLLQPAGAESGGFHLRSNSSDGKTTALRVAASVCGGPDYMQRWRATDNGLEALAMQHCDAPLLLDEIAQIDPKAAGDVAYMLANGGGKTRSERTGTRTRARLSWRLLFLSAGEVGLAQHMAEAGKTVRAGQELRLAEIPADAGAGLGVFENLHEFDNGSSFSKALDIATRKQHGTAFPAFLERLTKNLDGITDELHKAVKVFEEHFLTEAASGQARRVAHRFALVGAAGELATDWGITGWEQGEAMKAAGRCFADWLAGRGGEGNQEERATLAYVREILNRYGESAFTDWERPAMSDTHAAVRSDRMGYRRAVRDGEDVGEVHYYVFPDLFRSRLCKGFDSHAVGKMLVAHGYCTKGTEADRAEWITKVSLPAEGRQRRMVHILPTIWEGE